MNDLQHFHVADMQLPQDIMHVMLEGVIPYEIKLMLTEFISNEQYFSVDVLNDRMDCFRYSPEEIADKPNPLKVEQVKPGNSQRLHYTGMIVIP